jgi:hypothetical protein
MDSDLETGAFQVGQVLHLPKRGALTVNDKTQNANYTVQNPSSSTIDLTLDHHKEVTFAVESRTVSTVNQDVIQGYVEDAAIAIAEQIDTDLFTLSASVPSEQSIPITAAGVPSTITEGAIQSARKMLVDNKVPAPQRKYGVIATSQTNALLSIDRLVRYDALGVSNDITNATVGNGVRTMDASIGRLYGFELCESQLVPTSGSPAVASNLFYARDAMLMATRALELPDQRYGVMATVMTDPDSGITMRLLHSYQHMAGGHLITLDVLYGFTLMRPEHIVKVVTSA